MGGLQISNNQKKDKVILYPLKKSIRKLFLFKSNKDNCAT